MKFMLLLVVAGYSLTLAHSSVEVLPVNPGGIGGLFRGPNSETIIKGPDGSVITSAVDGGEVHVKSDIQPIVVAEAVVPIVQEAPLVEPLAVQTKVTIPEPHIIETEIVDAPAIEPDQSSDLIGPSGTISTRGSSSIVSGPASTTISEPAKAIIPLATPVVAQVTTPLRVPVQEIPSGIISSTLLPPVIQSEGNANIWTSGSAIDSSRIDLSGLRASSPGLSLGSVEDNLAVDNIRLGVSSTLAPPILSSGSLVGQLNGGVAASSLAPQVSVNQINDQRLLVDEQAILQGGSSIGSLGQISAGSPLIPEQASLDQRLLLNEQGIQQAGPGTAQPSLAPQVPVNQLLTHEQAILQAGPTIGTSSSNGIVLNNQMNLLSASSTPVPHLGSTITPNDLRINGPNPGPQPTIQSSTPQASIEAIEAANRELEVKRAQAEQQAVENAGREITAQQAQAQRQAINKAQRQLAIQRLRIQQQVIENATREIAIQEANAERQAVENVNREIEAERSNSERQAIENANRDIQIQQLNAERDALEKSNRQLAIQQAAQRQSVDGQNQAQAQPVNTAALDQVLLDQRQLSLNPASIPPQNIIPPEIRLAPVGPVSIGSNIQKIASGSDNGLISNTLRPVVDGRLDLAQQQIGQLDLAQQSNAQLDLNQQIDLSQQLTGQLDQNVQGLNLLQNSGQLPPELTGQNLLVGQPLNQQGVPLLSNTSPLGPQQRQNLLQAELSRLNIDPSQIRLDQVPLSQVQPIGLDARSQGNAYNRYGRQTKKI